MGKYCSRLDTHPQTIPYEYSKISIILTIFSQLFYRHFLL